MPKEFRMLLIGQKGIGKKTQAQKLSNLYGWPVFDYPALV
jgi:adenylate kinase family enzyme